MGRYAALDGVRGTSILFVLAGHVFMSAGVQDGAELGSLGVMVFFVLSGFLITDLLCREHASSGRISLSRFYLRRVLRLGPACAAFLIVLAGLIGLGWVTDVPWYSLAADVLYVRNVFGRGTSDGHLWSLSMEEQFYAVWPALLVAFGPKRARPVAIALIAGVTVVRSISLGLGRIPYESGVYYMRPWFRFDSLLFGCMIALLYREAAGRAVLVKVAPYLRGWVVLPAVTAWTIFAKAVALRPVFLPVQGLLAAGLVIGALAGSRTFENRFFETRPMRYLGTLSYSLYLWQQLFLATREPEWRLVRIFPLSVIVVFGCAMASYYLIEKPFLGLRDRIIATRPAAARVDANSMEHS